jgi:hypothetical protein
MFETKKTTLAQRTLGALRLTRSFLLLEDDYDVDWEVDLDRGESLAQREHPHRRALRGPGGRRRRARRPGTISPAPQHCISPIGGSESGTQERTSRGGDGCNSDLAWSRSARAT